MIRDIQILEEGAAIRAVYRGKAEYLAITQMLRKVARMASEKQVTRLLFDLRDADYRHYHVETIRHAEEGPALGISRAFRIAVLGSDSNPMLRYFEDVGVNRGYKVRAFTEEAEAEAWLRVAS
jgi:hypothetical protein